jgi:tetratricopeptide (TPR) repeat protein
MRRPFLLTSLSVALSLVSLFNGTAALAQPDPATNERTETEPYGSILVAALTEYQQSNFREAYRAFRKIAAGSGSDLKSLNAMDRVLALAGAGASAYQNYHYNEALSCFREATRVLDNQKTSTERRTDLLSRRSALRARPLQRLRTQV